MWLPLQYRPHTAKNEVGFSHQNSVLFDYHMISTKLHHHLGGDVPLDLVAHFFGWVTPTPFFAVQ